jgi:hypothetical protein
MESWIFAGWTVRPLRGGIAGGSVASVPSERRPWRTGLRKTGRRQAGADHDFLS